MWIAWLSNIKQQHIEQHWYQSMHLTAVQKRCSKQSKECKQMSFCQRTSGDRFMPDHCLVISLHVQFSLSEHQMKEYELKMLSTEY